MFDAILVDKGYTNRSEAVRDLIRSSLIEEKWGDGPEACGVLILVYDHHRNDLSRRLTNIQHEFYEVIITSLHIHTDHENCLEIIVLKGATQKVRELARGLVSVTGVKFGVFNPAPGGSEFK